MVLSGELQSGAQKHVKLCLSEALREDRPNVLHIVSHGRASALTLGPSRTGNAMNVGILVKMLKELPVHNLFLHSCFARQLGEKLAGCLPNIVIYASVDYDSLQVEYDGKCVSKSAYDLVEKLERCADSKVSLQAFLELCANNKVSPIEQAQKRRRFA